MLENPLATVTRIDPKLVEHMRSPEDWEFADGALPRKRKLLIAVACALGGIGSLSVASQRVKDLFP